MELWEEATSWLRAAGILSAEESSAQRLAAPADLAALLRDGVLLCELVLKLSPGCIKRQELSLQFYKSPFMCLKNISLFLQACLETFHLPPQQLFSENDLYDLEDFGSVLQALSMLSHTPQAKQFQLRPFPDSGKGQTSSSRPLSPSMNNSSSREVCADGNSSRRWPDGRGQRADVTPYCNLREEVERLAARPLPPSRRHHELSQLTSINSSELEEACHYDFILGGLEQRARTREQLYDTILTRDPPTSTSRLLPTAYTEFKPSNTREHSVKELLDTENNYCEALNMILENFYTKLSHRLPSDDIEAVFLNLRDIHRTHVVFLGKLTPVVFAALGLTDGECHQTDHPQTSTFPADPNVDVVRHQPLQRPSTISDVFILCKLNFTIYGEYCSGLNAAVARLDDLERTQSGLKDFIFELSTKANQNQFKLQDLLVLPMQRITKYPLLLKQLLGATTDVGEQAGLSDAVEAMMDVSLYVNESKRDNEAMGAIMRIQRNVLQPSSDSQSPEQQQKDSSMRGQRRSLEGSTRNFSEYGRPLYDGDVKLVDPKEEAARKQKQRYLFLFETMLLVCKRRGAFYELKHAHIISDWGLWENELCAINGGGGNGGSTSTSPSANTLSARANDNGTSTSSVASTLSRKLTATLFDNTTVTLVRRGCSRGSNNNENTIQLTAKSVIERNKWRKALREAIEANHPSSARAMGHSLLYKTYTSATSCSVCKKLLAGKFFQGYHCSGCDLDMHGACAGLSNCSPAGKRKPVPAIRRRQQSAIEQQFNSSPILHHQPSLPNMLPRDMENNGHGSSPQLPGPITPQTRARQSRGSLGSMSALAHSPSNGNLVSSGTLNRPPAERHLVSSSVITMFEQDCIASLSIDEDLDMAPWYFGKMERQEANEKLDGTENGTFLVRLSAKQEQFVISLSYKDEDSWYKHMKIQKSLGSPPYKFYLHDGRMFDSITELVSFYRKNSLAEGFINLNTCLNGTPLKSSIYRAIHGYEPNNREDPKYLLLLPGDVVTILDCSGEANGWWKGRISDRVGFFPMTYVKRIRGLDDGRESIVAATCSLTSPSTSSIRGSTNGDVYHNGNGHSPRIGLGQGIVADGGLPQKNYYSDFPGSVIT